MKASVIIATYGRNACLVDTIRSALLQDYPDFELVVVDQSPNHTPEVETFLRTLDDPRYSYYLVSPPSLPAARNFGLSHSTGALIIYIDDDVLLDPDFIQAHVDAYASDERIAAVGGRVRSTVERPSSRLFTMAPDCSWSGGFDYLGQGDLETVRGCNMSFRRAVLEEIKGFEPSYEGNALREETDVSFRLRQRGYRLRFEPLAALDHLVAADGGCREKDLWGSSLFYQNETLFYARNLGIRQLWVFVSNTFINNVYPLKNTSEFGGRLKVFFTGVARGLYLTFFPRDLRPHSIWELNRATAPRAVGKI